LTILAFVYVVKLLTLYPINIDSKNNDPNQNGINQGQQQQQQQGPYQQYYGNNNDPNQNRINRGQEPYAYQPYYGNGNILSLSYAYNDPTFKTYL